MTPNRSIAAVMMAAIFFGDLFSMILSVMMMTTWMLNRRRNVFQPERKRLYSRWTVAMPTLPMKDILETR